MNFETLFSEQKWNILEALSKGKYSPLQLAEKSKTTMANISQQLRLLEFSNLVKKEKIPNRDKGKPRSLFSLSEDHAYVISAMRGYADKKLLKLDKMHKILFRTLFLEDETRYFTERFFWEIEDIVKDIEAVAIKAGDKEINVVIVAKDSKSVEKKTKDVFIKKDGKTKTFKINVYSVEEANSKKIFSVDMELIYDPKWILCKSRGGDA